MRHRGFSFSCFLHSRSVYNNEKKAAFLPGTQVGDVLPLTPFCRDLPQFADRYSSAMEFLILTKVKFD